MVFGYTYLNTETGHEFSVVVDLTCNFENNDTDCRNGNSLHQDWGASKFLSDSSMSGWSAISIRSEKFRFALLIWSCAEGFLGPFNIWIIFRIFPLSENTEQIDMGRR